MPLTRLSFAALLLMSVTVAAHGNKHEPNKPHPPAAKPEHATEHPSPHGGTVFVLDPTDHLHAEVVFNDTGVRVWLFDEDMKPLAPPAAGKATVVVGKEVRKVELKRVEKSSDQPDSVVDPHLAGVTALGKDAKVTVALTLTVSDKVRTGRVERPAPSTPPAKAP